MQVPARSNRDFSVLGIDTRRTFVTRRVGGDVVGITRATTNHAIGLISPNAAEQAFFISYQRRRVFADLFLEDRNVPVPGRSDGRITVYDLRGTWQANFSSPFDTVGFHVPISTMEALAPDLHCRFAGQLDARPGHCIDDPVVRALADALMPAFENEAEPEPLFVDHIGWALATHVAVTYGGASLKRRTVGALGLRQQMTATALIEANLHNPPRLAEIAAACGLSVGHFTRAFRATTGVSPHGWLQLHRVARAKAMLLDKRHSIAEIALACGFCDQSHLSRVFTPRVGTTPARWRRTRLS